MRAVEHYNAGAMKIFGQLRLPTIALASTLCALSCNRHRDSGAWEVENEAWEGITTSRNGKQSASSR